MSGIRSLSVLPSELHPLVPEVICTWTLHGAGAPSPSAPPIGWRRAGPVWGSASRRPSSKADGEHGSSLCSGRSSGRYTCRRKETLVQRVFTTRMHSAHFCSINQIVCKPGHASVFLLPRVALKREQGSLSRREGAAAVPNHQQGPERPCAGLHKAVTVRLLRYDGQTGLTPGVSRQRVQEREVWGGWGFLQK